MRARTVALAALGLSLSVFAFADGKPEIGSVRPKPVETKPAPIGTPTPAKPIVNPKPPKPAPTTPAFNTQPAIQPAPIPALAPKGQTGQVPLPSGFALNVPAGFVFFPAADAHGHMARLDKAPPPGDVFGIIAPAGRNPTDSDFWGAVVSFNPIGRIVDDTADAVTRPGFLDTVKKGRGAQSPDAFITAPAWDAPGKTLSWAELYPTKGPQDRNIREEARVLTRDGALGFTALVSPANFDTAKREMKKFASAVTMPTGRRYADGSAADRAADYDVPGLITSIKRGQAPGGAIASLPGAAATPTPPSANPGTPLSGGGTPLSPVGPDASAAAKPADGGLVAPEWLTKYFPWIAAGVVGVPLLLWLLFGRRRREEYWDENLTPR